MLHLSNVISEFYAAATIVIIDLKIILYVTFRHIYCPFPLEISYVQVCQTQKERKFSHDQHEGYFSNICYHTWFQDVKLSVASLSLLKGKDIRHVVIVDCRKLWSMTWGWPLIFFFLYPIYLQSVQVQ
jgi:hypothetical protein